MAFGGTVYAQPAAHDATPVGYVIHAHSQHILAIPPNDIRREVVFPLIVKSRFEFRGHRTRKTNQLSVEVNLIAVINVAQPQMVALIFRKLAPIELNAVPGKTIVPIKSFIFPCCGRVNGFPSGIVEIRVCPFGFIANVKTPLSVKTNYLGKSRSMQDKEKEEGNKSSHGLSKGKSVLKGNKRLFE